MTDREKERIQSARNALWRWGGSLEAIRAKEDEIRHFNNLIADALDTLNAQRITGMPRGSGTSDPVGRAVEKHERCVEEYGAICEAASSIIQARAAEKRMVDGLIYEILSDEQIEVLRAKYEKKMDWREIADELGYEESSVRKREYGAVKKLAMRLEFN